MDEPQIRAWYMKGFVAAVDRLAPAEARAIRGDIGELHLRAIDESISMAWIPLEVNVAATHAVIDHLGRERARAFFPRMFRRQLDEGWLERFVQTGLRVLGMNPTSFLKWLPRGWPSVFGRCGELELPVLEEGRAVIRFHGLPPRVRHDERWLDAVLWGLVALTELGGRSGASRYGDRGPAGRWIDMELRWR